MRDRTDKCFGRYESGNSTCCACEYLASCQLFARTEGRMDKPLGGQCYEDVETFAADLAVTPDFGQESNADAPETSSPAVETDQTITARLGSFLRFLLSLDDYTLGILAAVIQGQNDHLSVAQLARIRHISRQGMHRKTLDAARKSPELAQLLACVVLKIRKAKGDFTKKPGPRTESRQMTFDF